MNWERTVILVTFIGVCLAILNYCFLPSASTTNHLQLGFSEIIKDLKFLANKKIILASLFGGLLIGPIEGLADAWGIQCLMKLHSIDEQTASYINSFIYIGMACGLSSIGHISKKVQSMYRLIIFCAMLMLIGLCALLFQYRTHYILYILFFLIGYGCSYQLLLVGEITFSVPEKYSSLIASFVNMIVMSFGFISHMVIVQVMAFKPNQYWITSIINIDNKFNYIMLLAVLILSIFLGIIGFFIINLQERGRKNDILPTPVIT